MSENTVALATGEIVDSSSQAWREECLARHTHVLNLRHLGLQMRRDYLEAVDRKEGRESRDRLAYAFKADWNERKNGGAA